MEMSVFEFFWNSDLTDERKRKIVKWVNSLTKDEQKMIEELRKDAVEETEFSVRGSE